MKKQQYIEVPASWFEGLLKKAEKIDGKMSKREKMEKIPNSITMLLGYVNSAQAILKYNKRIDY